MADQQDTGGGHRRPDDGQAMDGVEYPTPQFHSVTTTGDDGGNMLTVVELVTEDPKFLGDPPVLRSGLLGTCSFCGQYKHTLDGVPVGMRAGHRFDLSPAGGYYADELTAGAR